MVSRLYRQRGTRRTAYSEVVICTKISRILVYMTRHDAMVVRRECSAEKSLHNVATGQDRYRLGAAWGVKKEIAAMLDELGWQNGNDG